MVKVFKLMEGFMSFGHAVRPDDRVSWTATKVVILAFLALIGKGIYPSYQSSLD